MNAEEAFEDRLRRLRGMKPSRACWDSIAERIEPGAKTQPSEAEKPVWPVVTDGYLDEANDPSLLVSSDNDVW